MAPREKSPSLVSAPAVVKGWVEYKVRGVKPGIMRAAPEFLIDKTIEFIQVGGRSFVCVCVCVGGVVCVCGRSFVCDRGKGGGMTT